MKKDQQKIQAFRLRVNGMYTFITFRFGIYEDEPGWGTFEKAKKGLVRYLLERRKEWTYAIQDAKSITEEEWRKDFDAVKFNCKG